MSNGGINLASLGFGGIDTSSIVSGLVAVAQQPINLLQQQQQTIASARSSISGFSSNLSALSSAAAALSDPLSFNAMSASSSNSSVATTVTGSPAPGQWSVQVNSVAQEQRSMSNGTPSSTDPLGVSGTLGVTLGSGAKASIQIDTTDTLADITGKIANAGLHVQASMVYDGSQYHLLVAGLDTGKSNSVTFDESGLTPSGSYSLGLSATDTNVPPQFGTVQAAQDASVTVGGITVTSATNKISNAIPGVDIAVTQPTTSPVTISIASNPSAIQANVQAFVNAYNTVVNNGHTIAGFGSTKAQIASLQGDHGVRSSLDQLGSLMSSSVPGASGTYSDMNGIGIELNDDGTLTLDTAKLSAALSTDPTSVQRLFVTDPANGSTGVMGSIQSTIDQLSTGTTSTLGAELAAFTSRTTQITSQITNMQARIANYQTQLQTEFTNMNTQLAQYKQIAASLNQSSGNSNNSSNGVL
jgi:flagellar hook-associated protein 2